MIITPTENAQLLVRLQKFLIQNIEANECELYIILCPKGGMYFKISLLQYQHV